MAGLSIWEVNKIMRSRRPLWSTGSQGQVDLAVLAQWVFGREFQRRSSSGRPTARMATTFENPLLNQVLRTRPREIVTRRNKVRRSQVFVGRIDKF